MACPRCGCTGIHACPGHPIEAWTVEKMRELRAVLRQYETVPASRNQREGFYLGHGYGKAVRVRLGFHWPVRSANARAFRRGQLARQEARRTGVALCVTHMADQQGAS